MARCITTRDAGTCTSEDNFPVPIIPVGHPLIHGRMPQEPQPPRQGGQHVLYQQLPREHQPLPFQQPPLAHQPLREQQPPPYQQPPLAHQPPPYLQQPMEHPQMQQPPSPPPPYQPLHIPPEPLILEQNDRTIIMGMYRTLKRLERLVKQLQEDTNNHLREALPRTVKLNSSGMMSYVEPTVVALYVTSTTETKKCTFCNQLTENVCGTCRHAPYCSGYCMQRDYARHEHRCNLIVAATAQAATEALLRT